MRQLGKGSVAEGGLDVFAELLNMLILSVKSPTASDGRQGMEGWNEGDIFQYARLD